MLDPTNYIDLTSRWVIAALIIIAGVAQFARIRGFRTRHTDIDLGKIEYILVLAVVCTILAVLWFVL